MINKKSLKIMALACALFGSMFFGGCATDGANKKYDSWNVDTSTPLLEPKVSMDCYKKSKSNYWSFPYLFAVYEVDKKYAGFDILYYLDFTKRYRINYTAFENERTSWFGSLFPSRSERLKKMTLGDMCMKSDSSVVMSPLYKVESDNWILWQNVDCKTSFYGGKIRGFKVRGQIYKDAFIPETQEIKTPFIVSGSSVNVLPSFGDLLK